MRDPRYPVAQEDSQLPLLRALHEVTHRLMQVASRHIESMGVTTCQFDVLAVLGDTDGMSCKELSRQSLVSNGTLTPVLDRLEGKGLVQRSRGEQDGRQTLVRLSDEGQTLYEETFLPHIDYMRGYIDQLTPDEQETLRQLLGKLKQALSNPQPPSLR